MSDCIQCASKDISLAQWQKLAEERANTIRRLEEERDKYKRVVDAVLDGEEPTTIADRLRDLVELRPISSHVRKWGYAAADALEALDDSR